MSVDAMAIDGALPYTPYHYCGNYVTKWTQMKKFRMVPVHYGMLINLLCTE